MTVISVIVEARARAASRKAREVILQHLKKRERVDARLLWWTAALKTARAS